jgi:hypothetical protein
MTSTDRLTARERKNLDKLTRRLSRWALYAWCAIVPFLAIAVWLGDWRYVGLAFLQLIVALAFTALTGWLSHPETAQALATRRRDKERARAADLENLERNLGL